MLIHLKNHIKDGDQTNCPFDGGLKIFSIVTSFTAHLSRCHRNWSSDRITLELLVAHKERARNLQSDLHAPVEPTGAEDTMYEVYDVLCDDNDDDERPSFTINELHHVVKEKYALVFLTLQTKHHVPAKVIDTIVQEILFINQLN